MKKVTYTFASIIFLTIVACTKEKTTIVNPAGDSITTVTKISTDKSIIDSAKTKVKEDLHKTDDALKKGAKDVKEDLKKATSDAAAAVEKEAKDVKEKTEK